MKRRLQCETKIYLFRVETLGAMDVRYQRFIVAYTPKQACFLIRKKKYSFDTRILNVVVLREVREETKSTPRTATLF